MKTLIFLLIIWLASTSVFSQENEIGYVYRIVIQNPDDNSMGAQTGFKLNGKKGIYTALHGIAVKLGRDGKINIKAERFKPNSANILETIYELEIIEIDIIKDLVLLDSKKMKPDLTGLRQAYMSEKEIKLRFKDKLTVLGFPDTKILKTSQVTVQGPPILDLNDLLLGYKDYDRCLLRNSPGLKQKIIQLGSNEILPGHSGGPILDNEFKLIGIANGGRDNNSDKSISTWAIPFTGSKMNVYNKNDSKLIANLIKIKNLYSVNEIKEDNFGIPETHFYQAVNSLKKYPKLMVSMFWNRPAYITSDGLTISTKLSDLNVGLDLTIDRQINKWFYLGLYTSSRYFQYKMLGKFKYDLPIEVNSYNFSTKEQFDNYGIQTSAIFLRGVLHHFYLGAGGFYAGNLQQQNNYRAFFGLRKYIFHRQHLAIDIKALFTSKNQKFRIPTLGNSMYSIQPNNQYFLCAGLNYSFQKRH
jgi:hypothetical protein